ncbi:MULTISPECIES: Gfo/Idh/MocA family protein [unclassified Jeotgalibaca]|uniref:Gfo/Idh/MocA family protein n=1 Tax=unclassified Jeotgalibaca TaxID=2621505 RepID=UPI003FD35491
MLRSAIIGLGTVSSVHEQAIKETHNGQLVAVCDVDENMKENYPDIPFYTDVEMMLASEELDIVHICLPHYLHYPVTKICAEYGVNVLQEKPLALDYQEGLLTAELAKNVPGKIGICFQNRYNATFQALVRLLKEEDHGKVKAVKGIVAWNRAGTYYSEKPWRGKWATAGGGTIINQAIHTLDLLQLLGGELLKCKASLSNITDYDVEVEDTAVANFTFDNDVTGFYMSTNAYATNSSVEIEVVTEKCTYVIKNNQLFGMDMEGNLVSLAKDEQKPDTKSYYGPSHSILIQHFYDAVEQDTEDYVTVEEALPSMLMIDAMKHSTKVGRTIDMDELKKDTPSHLETSIGVN